jgi:hypothetical protein
VLEDNMNFFGENYHFIPSSNSAKNIIIVSKGDIVIDNCWEDDELSSGILFAPNGKVTYKGTGFEGVIFAKQVDLSQGGNEIRYKSIDNFVANAEDIPFE